MKWISLLSVFLLASAAPGNPICPLSEIAKADSNAGRDSVSALLLAAGSSGERTSIYWAAAAETEKMAQKIRDHSNAALLDQVRKEMSNPDAIVRGMAALVLAEAGQIDADVIRALGALPEDPRFLNQQWTNITSSAASDARIRAIDALVGPTKFPKLAETALVSLLSGPPKDPAVLFAQLHAAHLLDANPSPILKGAVKRITGPLASNLSRDRAAILNAHRPAESAPPQRNSFFSVDNERLLRDERAQLEARLSGAPGYHGTLVMGENVYAIFDREPLGDPRYYVRYERCFEVSPDLISTSMDRHFARLAGYAGYEINTAGKEVTLYFDRTMKWMSFPESLGPWKLKVVFVPSWEAEQRRSKR